MSPVVANLLTGLARAAVLTVLAVLTGCAGPPPPATPDIPATVAVAVEKAMPTATPAPTPDIPATVQAGVQAAIAALPTATPEPSPTLTPTPMPTATPQTGTAVNSALDLAAMVEQATQSVVRIETYGGGGSGILFETTAQQQALVLTNHHVIADANRIDVVVNDSRTYQGTVVGYDAFRDLAVLEICCGEFQILTFHTSKDIKPGTEVIAIGYALGISGSATITRGIVSAVRYHPRHKSWVLQTDASINPGNSGGPLLLPTGEVVGINTFVYDWDDQGNSTEGLGFAIAESSIQAALPGLKQGTKIARSTPIPTSMPTPWPTLTSQVKWRTYHNYTYDYSIDAPADWVMDDQDKSYVYFDSPDGFASASMFVPDYYIRSADEEMTNYIERLKKDAPRPSLFEVLDQGDYSGEEGEVSLIRYRINRSSDYCVEEIIEMILVNGSDNYWLALSVCEHSAEEYVPVLRAILDSLTFN